MRTVGHQPHRDDAQIVQYFSRPRVLARIRRIAQVHIGVGLGHALSLQRAALEQGKMAVPPSILIEPDDDAGPVLLDQRLGNLHLLTTVTLSTVKDMGCETVRMEAT